MKGDFSRSTFRPEHHYASVRQQQGRVQLDADANEAQDIVGHRLDVTTRDVVGAAGAPIETAGFGLSLDATNKILTLSPGRFYVDGVLVENEQPVVLPKQPHLSGGWAVLDDAPAQYDVKTLAAGDYAAVLDVWPRHLTALEEPDLLDPALGGVDTTTRVQTVWQVKLIPLKPPVTCKAIPTLPAWLRHAGPATSSLLAERETPAPAPNACDLSPSGGYQGLENQLYRVEIHAPGKAGGQGAATWKWATDNASIATLATAWDDTKTVSVASAGRDFASGWRVGDLIELIDEETELRGLPGKLVTIDAVTGTVLTLKDPHGLGPAASGDPAAQRGVRVRRWSGSGKVPGDGKAVPLGSDGVLATFDKGAGVTYRTGEYWLIPARTATADVDWPGGMQPPGGILHRFAVLGRFTIDNAGVIFGLTDCRDLFPPLTAMLTFAYAGGDGQQGEPNATGDVTPIALAQPLRVSVSRGVLPVAGAKVRFQIVDGPGGKLGLDADGTVSTLADGTAACAWALDPSVGDKPQTVVASLLDDGLQPIGTPIRFGARVLGLIEMRLNGGDTQAVLRKADAAAAATDLPFPLSVAVLRAGRPIAGLSVRFEIIGGAGAVNGAAGPIDVPSDANGIAECKLTLDANADTVRVRARLMKDNATAWGLPDVVFSAAALTVTEGGGCDISIGEGGQYPTLEEAMAELPADGLERLCFCFRPGVHAIKNALVIAGNAKRHFVFHGCGRASRLEMVGADIQGVASVVFHDLEIATRKAFTFLRVESVALRNLRFETKLDAPLDYRTVPEIVVENCAILGGADDRIALAIDHFEGVRRFVGNDIVGAISFGKGAINEIGKPVPGGRDTELSQLARQTYQNQPRQIVEPPRSQQLTLLDNRLSAMVVGKDLLVGVILKPQGMPFMTRLSGNMFALPGTIAPGSGIVCEGNRFATPGPNLLAGAQTDDAFFRIKIVANVGDEGTRIFVFGFNEAALNRPILIA